MTVKKMLYEAEKYYHNKEYEKALDLYIKLEKEKYNNKHIITTIANCYDAIGAKEKALEYYIKAYKNNKKSIGALSNLSIVYYEIDDLRQAKYYAQQALCLDASNVSALVILGNVYFQCNDYSKSVEYYEKAYRIDEMNYINCINLANNYQKLGNNDQAIEFAKKAINIESNKVDAYNIIANIYQEEENDDLALEYFKKSLDIAPKDVWTLNYISQVYQRKENVSQALKYALDAVNLSKGDNDQHTNMGYMLYELLPLNKPECIKYAKLWSEKYNNNPLVKYMHNAILEEKDIKKADGEYVKYIFDIFADDFDEILAGLEYCVPELVNVALQNHMTKKKMKILDAGCGTGLCGQYLKKHSKLWSLHGIDISKEMLRKAKERKLYNKLFEEDLLHFLHNNKTKYDLIVSADVLTYFGDLKDIFLGFNKSLAKKGMIIFSVTRTDQDENYILHPSGRFKHSKKYVEKLLEASGFAIISFSKEHLRNEGDDKVMGYIVVAVKK